MKYFNYGRNGSCVTIDDPRFGNALYKRYATDMNDSLDYVVVIAGHNDGSRLKEIGGVKEYEKRLGELLDGLRQRFPNAKIMWFTCWRGANAEKAKDFQKIVKSTRNCVGSVAFLYSMRRRAAYLPTTQSSARNISKLLTMVLI
jgi:hypothetical protein